jgi:hypothetical protein
MMRSTLVVGLGVVALLLVGTARAGEVERLREENARLQQRVRDLEAENTSLRGSGNPGDRGLVAALQERATDAVVVTPGEQPGASKVETEPSRLEGLGSGKSRHWIIWRAQRPANGRADAASLIVDSVDSGGKYRNVKALQLTVDGTPVEIPVADYKMQINTLGRETGTRQQGESVTARVPVDTLERLTSASSVSGTLGQSSFRLTPQQLADVREFAKRLGS